MEDGAGGGLGGGGFGGLGEAGDDDAVVEVFEHLGVVSDGGRVEFFFLKDFLDFKNSNLQKNHHTPTPIKKLLSKYAKFSLKSSPNSSGVVTLSVIK